LSRSPILLPRPPKGARLVERDLSGWIEDLVAAREAVARAEGYAEALATAAGALDESAVRLDRDREQAVEDLSAFATKFACEVARHLLRLNIEEQAHDIEAMVRSTLADSGVGRGHCVVHLNPLDVEALAGVTFRSGTELEADPGVPHGSVQITTPRGLLVRDVDDCIRHAAERIYGELRGTRVERLEADAAPDAPAPEDHAGPA
jgi:flagellar biosynthesis/type III secretory pathway protein FliH